MNVDDPEAVALLVIRRRESQAPDRAGHQQQQREHAENAAPRAALIRRTSAEIPALCHHCLKDIVLSESTSPARGLLFEADLESRLHRKRRQGQGRHGNHPEPINLRHRLDSRHLFKHRSRAEYQDGHV